MSASREKRDRQCGDAEERSALPHISAFQVRCGCGRFVSNRVPGTAWMASGEFGEDTEYACPACVAKPSFRLIAGNGSTDPRWCGIIPPEPTHAP